MANSDNKTTSQERLGGNRKPDTNKHNGISTLDLGAYKRNGAVSTSRGAKGGDRAGGNKCETISESPNDEGNAQAGRVYDFERYIWGLY